MSEEKSIEMFIKTRWWIFTILFAVMPITFIIIAIKDPTFEFLEGNELFFIVITIISLVALVISLFFQKIIERFSVDSSTQFLLVEVFCSGLRVFKKTYPFNTIDKFDIILINLRKSKLSSYRPVEILTLVLKSGKMDHFTGIKNRDNVKTWAMQLNNLLQVQGNFPAERFAEALTPHWPTEDSNVIKK